MSGRRDGDAAGAQFLAFIVVPEETLRIARRFQRRVEDIKVTSPEGTTENETDPSRSFFNCPFGTHSLFSSRPGVETPGYYRLSLRDKERIASHAIK